MERFIAYDAYSGDNGYFAIYDSAGNLVRQVTLFNSYATYISATALTNGNVYLSYSGAGVGEFSNLGQFRSVFCK